MLRNAPILLLDEPTSALDKRATKGALRALKNLMDNRTTLFVTHDLSLLEGMDRVYVVNDGRVDSLDAHGGLSNYEFEQT
jgi:ATP-binding cassette subfamily B protein